MIMFASILLVACASSRGTTDRRRTASLSSGQERIQVSAVVDDVVVHLRGASGSSDRLPPVISVAIMSVLEGPTSGPTRIAIAIDPDGDREDYLVKGAALRFRIGVDHFKAATFLGSLSDFTVVYDGALEDLETIDTGVRQPNQALQTTPVTRSEI